MTMTRKYLIIRLTIGCLLAFWTFFGSLELAETMASDNQPVTEDQQEQDLDQVALAQLAHAVKSDTSGLDVSMLTSVVEDTAATDCLLPFSGLEPDSRVVLNTSPLRLHQQISIYRI